MVAHTRLPHRVALNIPNARNPSVEPDALAEQLQDVLLALRLELREGSQIRAEIRRTYGGLLPRFAAQAMRRGDESAKRAECLCQDAQRLVRLLAGRASSRGDAERP
ncbi:MAG TPA: hypothetical protein VF032_15505 [Thermoleophilaceae bacterium]